MKAQSFGKSDHFRGYVWAGLSVFSSHEASSDKIRPLSWIDTSNDLGNKELSESYLAEITLRKTPYLRSLS
jgi:hypothetical protein